MEKPPKWAKFTRFEMALRAVLKLSKSELEVLIAADKKSKIGRPRPGPKPKK
jgi:hypothetical protein